MATLTDPPGESFRVSKLLNDTRYRSYTFQFIALLCLIALISWLGYNLAENLRAAGLNISYSFLGNSAGYDINQRLIEYDSQSTHWRAAMVGVLNTLLVAFLGCLMATIIGVFVGVLRLSKNWLIRKIMSIYVEIFRNVPVLIWILIIMAVFVAVLPQPRDFRGDDAEASMLFGLFAFTGRGFYTPRPIFWRRMGLGRRGLADRARAAGGELLRHARRRHMGHPHAGGHGPAPDHLVHHAGPLVGAADPRLPHHGPALGDPGACRLQLPGRNIRAQFADRAVVRAVDLHRRLHRRESSAPASSQSRAARPRPRLRSACGRTGS